jgi:hypothetical protein
MHEFEQEYLKVTISRLKFYKQLAEKTFDQLDGKDFHWQPGGESNSIAVIIQHMAGNMLSRWTNFLTEDGEKEWRQRDDEFELHDYSKEKLIALWDDGWKCFLDALVSLSPEDLIKTITIRSEALSVVDAINRQLAHYAYHVGQIVYVGRMIKKDGWINLSIPKGESLKYKV